MKKVMIFIFAMFLLAVSANFLSAINLQVQKTSSDEVLVTDISQPVTFNLSLTNPGVSDNFMIYNLVGFRNVPESAIGINNGETKNVTVEIWPLKQYETGYYTLTLYFKASDGTTTSKDFTFKIIQLKDAFDVSSTDISPESTSATFTIKNKENFDFGNVGLKIDSPFFKDEKSVALGPYEARQISYDLNKDDFKELTAGFYTLKTFVTYNGNVTSEVDGVINFVEKGIVTTTKQQFGFFVNTEVVTKDNQGNKAESAEITIKKNIITRLFTTFSPDPDVVERTGSSVYYTWVRELNPGEKFELTTKTNWLFPLILILFVILVVVLVRNYTRTSVSLRKSVQFVKAKGGEFALKVNITIHSKKFVERVNITDRLPPLVKVYDKFGGNAPTRLDEKTRKIEWNFDRLMPGEVRVLSYIVYSKVGIMGRFALPTATAIFEREGEIQEEESNRAFFVAEQRSKDIEE